MIRYQVPLGSIFPHQAERSAAVRWGVQECAGSEAKCSSGGKRPLSDCTGGSRQYHKGGSAPGQAEAGGTGAISGTQPFTRGRETQQTIREGNAMLQFESKKGV